MFGNKKEKRFIVKEEQSLSLSGGIQIVVDTETGVNYLVTISGAGTSGITPLLDANGTVVIDK